MAETMSTPPPPPNWERLWNLYLLCLAGLVLLGPIFAGLIAKALPT